MATYSRDLALGHEYNLLHNIAVSQLGLSSIVFDNCEELLWTGNHGGHITSYASGDLQKYTSFNVSRNEEVRAIVPANAGILFLTSNSLIMHLRRGLRMFTYCSEQLQEMICMTLKKPSGTVIMGGNHKNVIEYDITRDEEINISQISGENSTVIRNHPRFICSGDMHGKITLLDPNGLKIEHVIDTAHSGLLSDFDVHGNQLVSCGYTQNRLGDFTVERFLKVYDLRVMKSLTPIQMVFPPFLVRFIQAYTSRLCVVSQSGQFQVVDMNNLDQYSPYIQQIGTAPGSAILAFDTSASCQALAFGDATGYLHFYGTSNEVQFNVFSHPIEYADSVVNVHPIDLNDQVTPLSTIPMPLCEGKLLSDWPPELSENHYRHPAPINQEVLDSVKMVSSIGYAPNPGTRLRNQVPYELATGSKKSSQQDKKPSRRNSGSTAVPHRYFKQELKLVRDDLDYMRYNKSGFSGLEANLPNSYCNNMIQVLYFIEPLRCALLSHLCQREFCLACELGFLFHMLDTADGMHCQASNFLRAFRTSPEASAHGLVITDLYEAKKRGKLQNLVQNWTRFMLQQLHAEMAELPGISGDGDNIKHLGAGSDSIMNQLFGAKIFTRNCCRCETETRQVTSTLSVRLLYPECQVSGANGGKLPLPFTFADIVQRSLSPKQQINAWCETCKRFTSMTQTKHPKTLPDILVLTCGDNKQDIAFWETQVKLVTSSGEAVMRPPSQDSLPSKRINCRYGKMCRRSDCRYYHEPKGLNLVDEDKNSVPCSWIPFGLKLELKGDSLIVENWNIDDEKNKNPSAVEEGVVHAFLELSAIVSVVVDNQDSNKDTIVSCIKIGPGPHKARHLHPRTQWYLVNDHNLYHISPEEAVYLNFEWKWPSVLYFQSVDLNKKYNIKVHNPFKEQVFREDVSLAMGNGQSHVTFTPLSKDNYLCDGKLVAIDAEFVTLNQEEAEIRSDGTRSTIRPPHLAVARISCVRGEGPLEGVPFMDDYISTQEQVVDYLTQFSGIQPGDLDANRSSKHLTTLKATYQKLRYLIEAGVTFLGHGLKNDFRVINLVVPANQIIDTVYLFQLPNQRMVSLQFLAWHFLGLRIQGETHDSIEDAKTALQLYKKHCELKATNRVKEALKELYEAGRALHWKVPRIESAG